MKKLLLAILTIAPLTAFAAAHQRGDDCKVTGSIEASDNGNLMACTGGKLEYLQVIQNKLVIKELAQINQTQMQILEEVVKSKQAASVSSTN